MHCDIDIHLHVETQDPAGQWHLKPPTKKGACECCLTPSRSTQCPQCHGARVRVIDWVETRNYCLFAILGDVWGSHTGPPATEAETGYRPRPIAFPRGVPADRSDGYAQPLSAQYGTRFAASWLTVAELLRYDWGRTVMRCVVLTEAQFILWNSLGRPAELSKVLPLSETHHDTGTSGGTIVEAATMNAIMAGREPRTPGASYHVRVEMLRTYRDCVPEFMTETLPRLIALGNPERTRIVFYFTETAGATPH
jgi:hypothetical protein